MGRSDTGNGKDASGEDAGNVWPRVLADILKDIPKLLKSNAVACFAQATNLCRLTCIRQLAIYKTSQFTNNRVISFGKIGCGDIAHAFRLMYWSRLMASIHQQCSLLTSSVLTCIPAG